MPWVRKINLKVKSKKVFDYYVLLLYQGIR